jgi:hypothetical protein
MWLIECVASARTRRSGICQWSSSMNGMRCIYNISYTIDGTVSHL